MSTRWAYINKNPVGNISNIYCSRFPTDEEPTGNWIISRRVGDTINLKDASENSFFYYSVAQRSKTLCYPYFSTIG
jgi:hypothetical protein